MRIFGLAFDVRCGTTFSILMHRDPENLGDFPHRFNFFTELPILDSGLAEVQLRQVAVWLTFCHHSMPNYSSGLTREHYKVALLSNNDWLAVVAGWGDEQRIRLLLGDV